MSFTNFKIESNIFKARNKKAKNLKIYALKLRGFNLKLIIWIIDIVDIFM